MSHTVSCRPDSRHGAVPLAVRVVATDWGRVPRSEPVRRLGPPATRRRPQSSARRGVPSALLPRTVLDPLLSHAVEFDGERDEQAGEQLANPELADHSPRPTHRTPGCAPCGRRPSAHTMHDTALDPPQRDAQRTRREKARAGPHRIAGMRPDGSGVDATAPKRVAKSCGCARACQRHAGRDADPERLSPDAQR